MNHPEGIPLGNLLTVCPLSTGQARRHNDLFIPVKNGVSISLQADVDIWLYIRVRTEVGNGHTFRKRASGVMPHYMGPGACVSERWSPGRPDGPQRGAG